MLDLVNRNLYILKNKRAGVSNFKTVFDRVSYIAYRMSRCKVTQLLLNNHSTLKLSATFIYVNFLTYFLKIINYLSTLAKRHLFCMHRVPFIIICKAHYLRICPLSIPTHPSLKTSREYIKEIIYIK